MTDWSRDLSVRLFGRPEISSVAPGKFPAKGLILLALAICAPGRRLSRVEAAHLLWDGKREGESLTNLRQLLSRIRRLEPETGQLIAVNANEIRIGADAARIGLVRFLDMGDLETGPEQIDTLLLYRAELLAGIEEPTAGLSDWLLAERGTLRNRFFTMVDSVLVELTRYGRAPRETLVALKARVIALESEREASYRSFIEAFGRNGMFAEARELYTDLIAMSRHVFNSDPSPDTVAVVRRVFSTAEEISTMAGERLQPSEGPATMARPRVALLSVADPASKSDPALISALFEDIANELSRYRTFRILASHSSTSVVHCSGIPADNRTLNADFTISGFVKPGAEVTLAIRMTDCRNENLIWAGEYPAAPGELVRTFRTLSAQIASSLAAELEREMYDSLGREHEGKAYFYYLQGQALLKDCTLPGLRRARKTFRQSIRLDPEFALPHGRIAQTFYLEWLIRGGSEPELLLKAREYARKATQLDRGAAIGFWINAIVDLYQRNFDEAVEQFAEAESLSPNSADLLVEHADALGHLGEADRGWRKFERAIDLNPMPPDHYWWAGASIAFCQERYDQAIELCSRMENAEPAVRLLAASHALLGNKSEAQSYGRRIKEMYPSQPAGEIIKVAPTRVERVGEQFLKGLRIAGV